MNELSTNSCLMHTECGKNSEKKKIKKIKTDGRNGVVFKNNLN